MRSCIDPTCVWIRELRDGETDVLDAVFDGLSPESRRTRFHGPTPRLTGHVRTRLAAVDGRAHVAVAAFVGEEPIGIARLVGTGGAHCELAVEVVDAWQHRGVGSRLVRAVAALGVAAGYRVVGADVLSANPAAARVFLSVFPGATVLPDGTQTRLAAELTAVPEPVSRAA
jgi:GNAT superfamily N-acetyltransferase